MDKGIKIEADSAGWRFFARTSFVLALTAVTLGVYFLPVDLWTRGYMAMGALYLVVSSFTLAKTIRDEHESEQYINQIREAKSDKLLRDFELKS